MKGKMIAYSNSSFRYVPQTIFLSSIGYRKNDVGINLVFVVTCFHMYNVYEITDMMEIKISCYNHVNVLRKRAEKLTRFPNFI